MPHRSRPLPLALAGREFTNATAHELGVSPKRRRTGDLDDRIHGVRAPAGSLDDVAARCRAFAARLAPDVFFSHSTAARLLGAPLPARLERMQRLHVSVEAPARAPHARGLIGRSRRVLPGDVVVTGGIRTSSATRMWCEMASVLDTPDLVAVADYVIHHRRRLTSVAELGERLTADDRISRSRRLRVALSLTDEQAESRPESRLRVICVSAGLAHPEVNHEVADPVTGRGRRLDLAWPDLTFAIEYQGDHHRSREQWRADMTRRENLRMAGWTILELNADDLVDTAALLVRVRSALAR